MKKTKKFIRFLSISIITFVVELFFLKFLFRLFWGFGLFDKASYFTLYDFWEKGGVFNTFRDLSLLFSLLSLPIIGFVSSYKLYKYGFFKFMTRPIFIVYNRINKPKNLEIEQVSIKHLGEKDKTLDEIIAQRMEEKHKDSKEYEIKDLRRQISQKIEENKKQ